MAAPLAWRTVGLVATVVILAACTAVLPPPLPTRSALPQPSLPRTTSTPSTAVAQPASQWPTQSTHVPTHSPAPTGTLDGRDERPLSDAFWDGFITQVNPILLDYEFVSLDDAVTQAHVVVRGRVAEVYIGEQWLLDRGEPRVPLAYARIELDEVLKGKPVTRLDGFIEVQLQFVQRDWDPSHVAPLPAHESLFFLMHEATDMRRRGARPRAGSAIFPFAYFIPTPQAVLRNIGGLVAVVGRPSLEAHYGPTGFPLPLQGADFAELVEYVRGRASR